jgi:hypothetical protein
MRRFQKWIILALFLLVLGCAAPGEYVNPRVDPYGTGPSWWGMDAVCSPGCPVGTSGKW